MWQLRACQDSGQYIWRLLSGHRDWVCASGPGSQEIFTAKAMDEIHKASVGIPRMINRVCEKSLMYAFQQQKRLIDDYMTKYVVEHEMPGTVTG